MTKQGGFAGFTPEAFDFYDGLEMDNSKDYWSAHKATFDEAVKAPMGALLDDFGDPYGPWHVFRPYRDVRFSADKTPYKTHHGAVSNPRQCALHYVQLSAEGVMAAAGAYQTSVDQLRRMRRAVADDLHGPALEAILKELESQGFTISPGGAEPLRSSPQGYSKDHPRIHRLRWKGVVATLSFTDEKVITSAALSSQIRKFWDACAPLMHWLDDHVGPPDERTQV